jgi:uncharacterized protein (TIGR02246 family)
VAPVGLRQKNSVLDPEKDGVMPMKRVSILTVVALTATGLAASAHQATKKVAPRPAAAVAKVAEKTAAPVVDRAEDEKAIKTLVEAFTKAYDAGDAKAAAATYTETAVVVSEDENRAEGRATIEQQYADAFADSPGSTITIQTDSLRFLGPETALEEGRATVTPAKGAGAPEHSRYTTIYVKQNGHWLQAAVRDESLKDITAHDRLKELEWLVGDWVNESQDALVATTCKWADGGNFLVREFTMKTKGTPVMSGTQRLGWDPLKKQFKTWIFDSEGGHGEGFLARDGDTWTIKVEGVGREGLPVSATNIITRLGKDRMSWQSVDRTLGGASIPGIDEFTVVRKPPEIGK